MQNNLTIRHVSVTRLQNKGIKSSNKLNHLDIFPLHSNKTSSTAYLSVFTRLQNSWFISIMIISFLRINLLKCIIYIETTEISKS